MKRLKLVRTTKKDFILKHLAQQKEIEKVLDLKGTVEWSGSLRMMRRNRYRKHSDLKLLAILSDKIHYEQEVRYET